MRYALKFGYNGGKFSGSQRQPEQRTVEGDIIKAMRELKMIGDDLGNFRVASRTDAGVSAMGNVLAVSTDFRKGEILKALNSRVRDMIFHSIAEVPDDFNPRHAKLRWYRYMLAEDYDTGKMEKAAKLFEGEHDFRNFCKEDGRPTVKAIERISVTKEGQSTFVDFYAQTLLWNQIRRIVSALRKHAAGEIALEDVKRALEVKEDFDFGLANPEPLFLMDVIYDINFETDMSVISEIRQKIKEMMSVCHTQESYISDLEGVSKD